MISIFKQIQGWVKLKGGTDNNNIGNEGDALKVVSTPQSTFRDAFSRLRTSTSSVDFEAYFVETDKASLFDSDTSGSGTLTRNTNQGSMSLNVGTASGDKVIFQSKEYFRYTPGISPLLIMAVCPLETKSSGRRERYGQFDANNGIFFEHDGDNLKAVIRSNASGSVVDTPVSQSTWNIDTLDGTGKSGITLDFTKSQILVVDYQWLSLGRVRFGFDLGGNIVYVHEANHANLQTGKYMRTATLPFRFEVENTTAQGSSGNALIHCMAKLDEGKTGAAVQQRSANNNSTFVTIRFGNYEPVLSIRLKAANVRGTLVPLSFSTLVTTNDDYVIQVVKNATLTGASWTDVSSDSIAQFDTSSTAISGGTVLLSQYSADRENVNLEFADTFEKIVADFAGTSDTLTISMRSLVNNANAYASINWEERF